MKVYIASHDKERAQIARQAAEKAGHFVVSTWHDSKGPVARSADLDAIAKRSIAIRNTDQIRDADTLILIASEDKVPGGKFVEAGIAIGLGKQVVVVGRIENILLNHPGVQRADDFKDAINLLVVPDAHNPDIGGGYDPR